MKITPTTFTIVDYCTAMTRKEIIVDRAYQRSAQVWPHAARSFLIESILLGYPIPKLYLYQQTDLKSRKTIKHIVDGQQRSFTILDFYENKLKMSRSSELTEVSGKTFEELGEEYQQKFVDYALSTDLFVSASPEEIREVFRRINSYTVPLNPEEKRHSRWQGAFKWFIYNLSRKFSQSFVNMGVFNDKHLIRMADDKLLSEISFALLKGITTTTAPNLDKMYKEFDDVFPHAKMIEGRIVEAINTILGWPEIHNTELMKPHIFYGLILAVSHLNKPVDRLVELYAAGGRSKPTRETAIGNLTALSEALEEPETSPKKFEDFILASARTTNDAKRRAKIFECLCKAIALETI